MLPEDVAVLLVAVSISSIGWTGLRINMALVSDVNALFLRSSFFLIIMPCESLNTFPKQNVTFFQREMISDVKALLRVLFMFLPLPLFWTLFDQQVRDD